MVKKAMKKEVKVRGDVSKGTVAILLVIAIILSVLSTWLVLTKTSIVFKQEVKQPSSSATAQLTIGEGNEPAATSEQGSASLTIKPNK